MYKLHNTHEKRERLFAFFHLFDLLPANRHPLLTTYLHDDMLTAYLIAKTLKKHFIPLNQRNSVHLQKAKQYITKENNHGKNSPFLIVKPKRNNDRN